MFYDLDEDIVLESISGFEAEQFENLAIFVAFPR